jgi:hypothetical protein
MDQRGSQRVHCQDDWKPKIPWHKMRSSARMAQEYKVDEPNQYIRDFYA